MNVTFDLQIGKNIVEILCKHFVRESELTDTALHNHRYTEIHILVEGSAKYTVGGKEYLLQAGDALCIPGKLLHASTSVDSCARYFAFSVRVSAKNVAVRALSPNVLAGLKEAIKDSTQKESLDALIPYFYMLCKDLLCLSSPAIKENRDYPNLIFKYLDDHYTQDISLPILAEKIGLSPRQIQRIVQQETGNTFLEELTDRRMKTAEYLMNHSDMSAAEIAQYVGYNSYSGFWKARKHYKKEQE